MKVKTKSNSVIHWSNYPALLRAIEEETRSISPFLSFLLLLNQIVVEQFKSPKRDVVNLTMVKMVSNKVLKLISSLEVMFFCHIRRFQNKVTDGLTRKVVDTRVGRVWTRCTLPWLLLVNWDKDALTSS